jgi:hypothetical protein
VHSDQPANPAESLPQVPKLPAPSAEPPSGSSLNTGSNTAQPGVTPVPAADFGSPWAGYAPHSAGSLVGFTKDSSTSEPDRFGSTASLALAPMPVLAGPISPAAVGSATAVQEPEFDPLPTRYAAARRARTDSGRGATVGGGGPGSAMPPYGSGASAAAPAGAAGSAAPELFAVLTGLLLLAAISFSRLRLSLVTWRSLALVTSIDRPD